MSTIYLVDDHEVLRDGLRALLEASGHRVVGASAEPTQALAEIQRLTPEVLVLDVNLGELSGLDLLAEMQKRRLRTRTIVLTMSAQPRHVAEAIRLGAAGYLLKGAPSAELLRAVQSVLEGRRHLGVEAAELAVRGLTEGDEGDALQRLSARERQILQLVVRGRTSAEIGGLLHLSPKTVDTYRSRLMGKLGVGDMPALMRLAIRAGIVDADER